MSLNTDILFYHSKIFFSNDTRHILSVEIWKEKGTKKTIIHYSIDFLTKKIYSVYSNGPPKILIL